MLAEIEDKLVSLLREKLVDVPKENIFVDAKPSKLPAVMISNLKFEFDSNSITENLDQGNLQIEENFDSDGVKTSFKFKEKPQQKGLIVESPPGTLLHGKDYTVNFDERTLLFKNAPLKGKGKIFVRYKSQRRIITLKSLKVKATYSVDILSGNRKEADALAEKVVKSLLTVENHVFGEGVEIEPVGGTISTVEEGKTVKVQLQYAVETEIRVEQVVGPIEKIEISQKDILQ